MANEVRGIPCMYALTHIHTDLISDVVLIVEILSAISNTVHLLATGSILHNYFADSHTAAKCRKIPHSVFLQIMLCDRYSS